MTQHRGLYPILVAALLLALPDALFAQKGYQLVVNTIEGTARVQHPGNKLWENLSAGAKINDNDIVETFFKTKLSLKFGQGGIAALGSNSKALFNIAEKLSGPKGVVDAGFTLFNGGIFVRLAKGAHVSILTSNGVAELDSGAVSGLVDGKTGETGFQIFGGLVSVRNLAQQKSRVLTAGQTTMVLPGREPTAALYLTSRHIAVLKHFFGDEYITNELKVSNITPTEEAASSSRQRLSQNLGGSSAKKQADEGMYRRLFNLEKIYGAIVQDQGAHTFFYQPVLNNVRPFEKAGLEIGYTYSAATAAGSSFPAHGITAGFSIGSIFDAAARLSFLTNATGELGLYSFSGGTPGILDVIDHVTIGYRPDSLYLFAGPINNLTIGQGLVVNHYSNSNPAKTFKPLGVQFQGLFNRNINIQGFIGDAATLSPGGIYASFQPSAFFLGAGFYIDPVRYPAKQLPVGQRFMPLPATMPDTTLSPFTCYEATIGGDAFSTRDITARLTVGITQNLSAGDGSFTVQIPQVQISMPRMVWGGGLLLENGRTLSSQFSYLYPSNSARVVRDSAMIADSLPPIVLTQNDVLSKNRHAGGIKLFFRASPWNGCDFDLEYKQDFTSKSPLAADTNYHKLDFDYMVRAAINDSLVPLVHFAELYFRQMHGGLYPANSLFPSWGLQFGFHLLTNPIIMGAALQGGFDFSMVDVTGYTTATTASPYTDNRISSEHDKVFEWYVGLRWSPF